MMAIQKGELRNYLLGRTTEAENEEIGVRMMEDATLSTAMALAENELVEDYIEGALSDEEVKLFRRHFLANDERRDLVNEVALLKRYSSGSMPAYVVQPERQSPPLAWFWRPAIVGVCCLAIVLGGLLVWRAYKGGSGVEAEYAAINRADLADPTVAGKYKQVTVTPGTYRNANTPVQSIPAETGDLLLRLPLTFAVPDGTKFDAEITSGQSGAFRISDLTVIRTMGLNEVRVVVPGSALAKGTNRIVLHRQGSDAAPVVYDLEVG